MKELRWRAAGRPDLQLDHAPLVHIRDVITTSAEYSDPTAIRLKRFSGDRITRPRKDVLYVKVVPTDEPDNSIVVLKQYKGKGAMLTIRFPCSLLEASVELANKERAQPFYELGAHYIFTDHSHPHPDKGNNHKDDLPDYVIPVLIVGDQTAAIANIDEDVVKEVSGGQDDTLVQENTIFLPGRTFIDLLYHVIPGMENF